VMVSSWHIDNSSLLLVSSFARASHRRRADVGFSDLPHPSSSNRDHELRPHGWVRLRTAPLAWRGWEERAEGSIGGTALVTAGTCKLLGAFDKDYLEIAAGSAGRVVQIHARERQIFPKSGETASEEAEISPNEEVLQDGTLYLKHAVLKLVGEVPEGTWVWARRYTTVQNGTEGGHVPATVGHVPATASHVTLARVARHDSSGTESYSRYLRRFLSSLPVLTKGDIFGVWVPLNNHEDDEDEDDQEDDQAKKKGEKKEGHDEEQEEEETGGASLDFPSNELVGHTLVYFQVTAIEPSSSSHPSVRIDPRHTRIISEGKVHSLVPPVPYFAPSFDAPQALVEGLVPLAAPAFEVHTAHLRLPMAVLVHGPQGAGKCAGVRAAAAVLGVDVVEASCASLALAGPKEKDAALQGVIDSAAACAPCLLLLRRVSYMVGQEANGEATNTNALAVFEEKMREKLQSKFTSGNNFQNQAVVVIASTDDIDDLDAQFRWHFTHELECPLPDLAQRRLLLPRLARRIQLHPDVSLESLAMKTAGKSPEDMLALLSGAESVAYQRILSEQQQQQQQRQQQQQQQQQQDNDAKKLEEEEEAEEEGAVVVMVDDVNEALAAMQSQTASAIGAPKVPNVKWDDVGGLTEVKGEILDTVQLPLKHPELFASGLKQRSGVLLYGPPGTGKTLLAKAVATECALSFLSVKGPELINMYIGESEKNIRQVFKRGREAVPCVLFFDELDSLAPHRGAGQDSGGVMDRVVSQLLAELDGIGGGQHLFVMAATNRPDLIDPALLRPGRFDKLLYCGVGGSSDPSTTRKSQLQVLKALTRKFALSPDVDLDAVAALCPDTYTGADLYALCADAWMRSAKRLLSEEEEARKQQQQQQQQQEQQGQHQATLPAPDAPVRGKPDPPKEVVVTQADFVGAQKGVVPSVTAQSLAEYQSLRAKYSEK